MRYVEDTVVRYNLRLKRETTFRLTYAVSPGPRPGIEKWFRVRIEELQ
jgi:hypothetical protein